MKMSDDDLFEQLRRANPVPSGARSRRSDPDADELLAQILRSGRPRPRRALVLAAVVALLLVALTVLVGFFVLREDDTDSSFQVACFATADIDADRVLSAAGDDPRRTCGELWRAGKLGTGDVPNFATCVHPGGGLAVFPGESGTTCVELRLAVASPSRGAIDGFAPELQAAFRECPATDDPVSYVRGALAQNNLADWDVAIDRLHPIDDDNPCPSFHVDEVSETVVLSGVPRPRTP